MGGELGLASRAAPGLFTSSFRERGKIDWTEGLGGLSHWDMFTGATRCLRYGVQWAASDSTRESSRVMALACQESPSTSTRFLTIKGSSTGAPYPEPRCSWAACRLDYSWRWCWPSTCRKLEAGIQQGIVPEKIPGYTAKTDRPLSQIPSAWCPTSQPQPIWL